MRRAFEVVESAIARLTYAALFLMMAAITVDAVGRYVLRFTLTDVFNFTELYLMPLAIFSAMAFTQRQRGHVNVTLLSQFFPARTNAALQGVIFLVTAAICALITYGASLPAWSHLVQWRVTGGVIQWPTGLSRAIVPIGMGLLCLRLIVDGVGELLRAVTNDVSVGPSGDATKGQVGGH